MTTSASPRGRLVRLWPYALVALVGAAILLPRLGDYGLWDPWEPKYAEGAREMNLLDSYVVPYYRGEVRLAKPILTYWGVLAGSAVFGFNELGARIGGALFALLSLLGVYHAVRRLRDRRTALLSALILATTPQFYFLARQATPDVYLMTSLGLATLFLGVGMFGTQRGRRRYLAASYVMLAIAILAKGPIVAGALYFGPLAFVALARADWPWLLGPSVGRQTRTMLLRIVATLPAVAGFGLVTLLFATSKAYWGYSEQTHARLLALRERLVVLDANAIVHAAALLLIGIPLGYAGWRAYRHFAALGQPGRATTLAGLSGMLALTPLLGGIGRSAATRVLLVGAAGLTAALLAVALALALFLGVREVRERIGGPARFVAGQAAVLGVIVAALAGPWYVAILIRKGRLFVNDFLIYNHVTRATETINQSGDVTYYWEALIYAFFPWCCLFPAILALTLALRGNQTFRRMGFESFLCISVAVTLAAFGSSVTKFAHYLAPAVIPLATLSGVTVNRLLHARGQKLARLAWGAAFVLYVPLATALLGERGAIYLVGVGTVKRWIPESVLPGALFTWTVLGTGVLFLAAALLRSRIPVAALVAVLTVFAVYWTTSFVPALTPHKSMQQICATWQEQTRRRKPLGFHGTIKHSMFYYCGMRISYVEAEEFTAFMEPGVASYCIVERTALKGLERRFERAHPDHRLEIVDDSHFAYKLVSNLGRPDAAAEGPPDG